MQKFEVENGLELMLILASRLAETKLRFRVMATCNLENLSNAWVL